MPCCNAMFLWFSMTLHKANVLCLGFLEKGQPNEYKLTFYWHTNVAYLTYPTTAHVTKKLRESASAASKHVLCLWQHPRAAHQMVFNAPPATDKRAMELWTAGGMRTTASALKVTASRVLNLHLCVLGRLTSHSCTNTLSVLLVTLGDTKVNLKGCASRVVCSSTANAQLKMAMGEIFTCCEGNHCNGGGKTGRAESGCQRSSMSTSLLLLPTLLLPLVLSS